VGKISIYNRVISLLFSTLLLFALVPTARAGEVLIQTSLYTQHFVSDMGHNNHQHLVAAEYHTEDGWLIGGWLY
jgi:hypothetical protein